MAEVRQILGLDESEAEQLKKWREDRTRPPLGLDISTRLFQLFLHGYSCEEIQQQNPVFHIGQILEARDRDHWDKRRQDYTDRLFATIFDRVHQTQMESVAFTTDLLAAAHKLFGGQLRAYIQSGKEEDLGKAAELIKSLDAYRKVADLLLKMTGQDKDKDRRPEMLPKTVIVTATPVTAATPADPAAPATVMQKAMPPGTSETMPADMAARVLDYFAEKDRERERNGGAE